MCIADDKGFIICPVCGYNDCKYMDSLEHTGGIELVFECNNCDRTFDFSFELDNFNGARIEVESWPF